MEKRINKHVEDAEFYKEVARLTAVSLLGKVSLDEMLRSPAQFVDDFLAALLNEMTDYKGDIADEALSYASDLGLAALDGDMVDAIVQDAERNLLTDSRARLMSALIPVDERISNMLDAGVSADTISKSLASEATRDALLAGFIATARSASAGYVQDIERGIVETSADETVTAAQDSGEEEPPNFEWLAILDGRACDDAIENSCAPRHGVVMTMDQWEEMGRPGAANLICSIFSKGASPCRCVLLESGKTGTSEVLNPVDVTEAIKAGKERAASLVA